MHYIIMWKCASSLSSRWLIVPFYISVYFFRVFSVASEITMKLSWEVFGSDFHRSFVHVWMEAIRICKDLDKIQRTLYINFDTLETLESRRIIFDRTETDTLKVIEK